MRQSMLALGLMSGTSLDGMDAAIIETDGERIASFGPVLSRPYDNNLRERIRACLGQPVGDDALGVDIADAHADLIAALLQKNGLTHSDISVVGFHGQTTDHRPDVGVTVQIGDGARLAERVGIDVVNNFRRADVTAGGEGAPFAPLYHMALADTLDKPLAVLNLGGVGNVTWIGPGGAADVLAFDTGPANALIDDWVRAQTGQAFDRNGDIAASGQIFAARVSEALAHPYFARQAPKSLDRNDFTDLAVQLTRGLETADGAATLAAFTVQTVAAARRHLPGAPAQWLVTGGGRHNGHLRRELASALAAPVNPVEAVDWRGDFLEAEAFAYLAVRSLRGLPLSLPQTTGVRAPMTGGQLYPAP